MMRGCVCRWCGEDVTRADERYEAMDGRAVHAECMEEFLLETVGLEVLAREGENAIREEYAAYMSGIDYLPEELPERISWTVAPEEIDSNGHLNNVKYILHAEAMISRPCTCLEVLFDRECFVGETLTLESDK